MIRGNLDVPTAFVAVAEERSFTKAAVRLGVSTSALSHAIRGFEESGARTPPTGSPRFNRPGSSR
jgi:hypothetical protein